MRKGDLEKRVMRLESQIVKPQEPVEIIFVNESNYLEKEKEIKQAEKEGYLVIAIHEISGREGEEPTDGYAEYLK